MMSAFMLPVEAAMAQSGISTLKTPSSASVMRWLVIDVQSATGAGDSASTMLRAGVRTSIRAKRPAFDATSGSSIAFST
jgi:hypothetical protein